MHEKFWIQNFETGGERLRGHITTDRGKSLSFSTKLSLTAIDGPPFALMKRTAFFIARSCHLRGNSKRRLSSLTEANLKLSAEISVGMALGFVEEAPLLMIYEYEPGRQKVIDLSSEKRKYSVRNFSRAKSI